VTPREEPPAPPAPQIASPETDTIEEMVSAPPPAEEVEWNEVDEPPAPSFSDFPGDRPMR